jgi:hypothetical protein
MFPGVNKVARASHALINSPAALGATMQSLGAAETQHRERVSPPSDGQKMDKWIDERSQRLGLARLRLEREISYQFDEQQVVALRPTINHAGSEGVRLALAGT